MKLVSVVLLVFLNITGFSAPWVEREPIVLKNKGSAVAEHQYNPGAFSAWRTMQYNGDFMTNGVMDSVTITYQEWGMFKNWRPNLIISNYWYRLVTTNDYLVCDRVVTISITAMEPTTATMTATTNTLVESRPGYHLYDDIEFSGSQGSMVKRLGDIRWKIDNACEFTIDNTGSTNEVEIWADFYIPYITPLCMTMSKFGCGPQTNANVTPSIGRAVCCMSPNYGVLARLNVYLRAPTNSPSAN